MARKTNFNAMVVVLAIIIAIIFFGKEPKLEAALSFEDQLLTLNENQIQSSSISLKNNERATSAKITVIPVTNIGSYSIDIGELGIDFTGTTMQTFDVTKDVNDYMEFCVVEVCNIPFSVKVTNTGNITVTSDIQTEAIVLKPAAKVIEREKISTTISTNVVLFAMAVLFIIFILFPKSLKTLKKKL